MKKQKKISAPPAPIIEPETPKMPFDIWWILYSSQRKLSPDLKEPIQKHFQARGFWETQDWDAGIKDFGL